MLLFREQDGACRIEKVRVETLITFIYPQWNNPNNDEKLAEWWSRNLRAVEDHERGHEITSRNASREIYDTLYYLPSYPTCSELKQAADARAQAVIAEAKKTDDTYDLETDHGRRPTGQNP
jgi:predicted secreted Zn-dependent protease